MRAIAAVLVVLAGPAAASGRGTDFADGIRLAQTAWTQGVGEAQAATADGVTAIGLNPAGVLGGALATFHLTHSLHVTRIGEDYFAYAQRLPAGSAVGVGLYALHFSDGTRQLEDANGNWGGEAGTYPMLLVAATAAYAMDLRAFLPGLDGLRPAGGVAVRLLSQQVDQSRLTGGAVDVGVRLRPGGGLSVALVAQHLGLAEGGLPPPRQFVGAVAWQGERVFGGTDTLVVEVDAPVAPDRGFALRVGGEYRVVLGTMSVAARAGWKQELGDAGAPGLTGGVGFRRLGGRVPWGLDYAVQPFGDLGLRHAVSVTFAVPAPLRAGARAPEGEEEGSAPPSPPLRVFYPRKGERIWLPVEVDEATRISARVVLAETGETVAVLSPGGAAQSRRREIVWDGRAANGSWARFDVLYRVLIETERQTFAFPVVPKDQ